MAGAKYIFNTDIVNSDNEGVQRREPKFSEKKYKVLIRKFHAVNSHFVKQRESKKIC